MTFRPANNANPSSSTALHHMGMPLRAEQLHRQEAAHGVRRREHLGSGQVALADHPIESHCNQCRQEQKQSAELGGDGSRLQAQARRVRRVGGGGFETRRTLVVHPSGQLGESLLLEHCRHGRRGSRHPLLLEGFAYVVDRLVLFPELNDLLLYRLRGLCPCTQRFGEELSHGALTKLVGQLIKAADGVAETYGNVRGRNSIDEVGPQGFVLPLGRVLWSEEDVSQIH